jgi:hypothetical protein
MQQFRQLAEMEKVSAIMQFGRLMAQSTENESIIFLYRVESFYVSACYSLQNDQLIQIDCLEINELLPPFRKHILSAHPAEREYEIPEI